MNFRMRPTKDTGTHKSYLVGMGLHWESFVQMGDEVDHCESLWVVVAVAPA